MNLYPLDASLTLAAAAPKWLAAHQQYIRLNTLKGYRNSIRLLTLALGAVLLKEMSIEHIREYQAERSKEGGALSRQQRSDRPSAGSEAGRRMETATGVL